MDFSKPRYSLHVPIRSIDIVALDYNKGDGITTFAEVVIREIKELGLSHSIILIDDGSSDNSWNQIRLAVENNFGVKGVRLQRNFGQHKAILAGLRASNSDMARNPEVAIRQVCSFLQISYVGFDDVGSFGSRNVKSPHLQSMFRRLLRSKLDVVTEGLREQSGVTLSKTQKLVSFNLSEGKEPIDAGVRTELFNYYLEHNIRLTQLLSIDTSDWN